MSTVQSDPQEIRRFQGSLRQFNNEISNQTSRIQGQLNSLGNSWRDAEYQKFSSEIAQVIQVFQRYLQNAEGYLTYLDRKAEPLERYLGR